MLTEEQKKYADRMKIDPDLRREFWRHIIRRPEWKQVLTRLNHAALSSLADIANEMSLEQVTFVLQNIQMPVYCSALIPSVRRKPRPETIHVWVIYWLYRDGDPDCPLYVGQTRRLSERWTAHKNGSSETASIDDLSTIRIKVVETVCGSERQALEAEKRHIKAALTINRNLLNKASV